MADLPPASAKIIFAGEASTVWRIFVPGSGTYDVTTYPGSELIMIEIAGSRRRVSELQGRKLSPILQYNQCLS